MDVDRETLLQVAQATAPVGSWMLNGSTGAVHVSSEVRELLDLSPAPQLSLRRALHLFPPAERRSVAHAVRAALKRGQPFRLEANVRNAGRERTLQVCKAGKPMTDDHGRIVGVRGCLQDITQIRETEAQAQKLARRLESTLEGMSDAFFLVDRSWRFQFLNHEAERLLQCNREELLGSVAWDAFPDALGTDFEAHYRQALSDDQPAYFEAYYPPIDTWFEVRAFPTDQGLAVYFRNITERKEREAERRELTEALREARDRAESANQAKSKFLSAMSHELRTPLNAVIGFAQLLLEQPSPAAHIQQRYTRHILDGGWHLRELVDKVLHFAQLDAGHLEVHNEPLAVTNLIRGSLKHLEAEAERRQVHLLDWSPEHSSLWVNADPLRARQALTHLLENAIRYNRPGGQVRVGWDAFGGQVHIDVSDTGTGITAAQCEHLFNPFERLGRETSTEMGSGLGLTLARQLARRMGGDVRLIRSVPERGATFRMSLPAPQFASSGHALPGNSLQRGRPGQRSRRMEILYIEDNELNMMVVRGLLTASADIHLHEAWTGAQGLEAARHCRPDLILLDLHLPDMHGREVLAGLQKEPELRGTPVVVISADASTDASDELLHQIDSYLVKPFRISDLETLIERFAPL